MTDITPYDRAAEVAVLNACLSSATARETAKRHLVGSDFYDPRHETIWTAMHRLERSGKQVEPIGLLALLSNERTAVELMPEIVTAVALPDHVGQYAEIIRSWSTKRRIENAARKALQRALSPDTNPVGYAATVAAEFAAIRDSGIDEDTTTKTLTEVLAQEIPEPDWVIPGYIERMDRLVLTGEEGLGKSHLLRQFAISAAAGIDPFDPTTPSKPARVLIIDCENTETQVHRQAQGMVGYARHYGRPDVSDRVFLCCTKRMDIARDKDLAMIHRELDLWNPDLVIIGPLYRLVPRAIQNDDDAAPILAALDTIRDRGIALLIEAHAGHSVGKGGQRDLRPRGSSALLGWPEFGYGLRNLGAQGGRYAEFIGWRGQRSERDWPRALRRADDGVRWVPYDGPTEVKEWSA